MLNKLAETMPKPWSFDFDKKVPPGRSSFPGGVSIDN
jgi:hypothetical protein